MDNRLVWYEKQVQGSCSEKGQQKDGGTTVMDGGQGWKRDHGRTNDDQERPRTTTTTLVFLSAQQHIMSGRGIRLK